jgi:glycosyltransferase 2 family protein
MIVIGLAVLALLLSRLNTGDLRDLWARARPAWLLVGLGCYALMQVVRGWRLHTLTRGALPAVRLAAISCIQNLLLTLLPMRSGEISFVALLAREERVGVAWATKILVAVRLLDLAVVLGLFLVAVGVPGVVPPVVRATALPVAGLLMLVIGMLMWPQTLGRLLRPPVMWLTSRRPVARLRGAEKLRTGLEHAVTIADPEHFRRSLPLLWLQSLLLWALAMGLNYSVAAALGTGLSLLAVMYFATVLIVSSVLPIHGLGGYGPHDAIGAALLVSLGLPAQTAIAIELSWRTATVLTTAVLGAIGAAYLSATGFRRAGEDEAGA